MTPGLRDTVLERMGLAKAPAVTSDGLAALYLAWCRNIPFDNLQKRIAVATNPAAPLPGMTADAFFSAWMTHGTGGTCWSTANACWHLLTACGFSAVRGVGSMGDRNDPNHGTVLVEVDGQRFLVDTSMLNEQPVALHEDRPTTHESVLHPVAVEPATPAGIPGTLVQFRPARTFDRFPCRLLQAGVDEAFYVQRFEISRGGGPFNAFMHLRRNFADRVLLLLGTKRVETHADGRAEETTLSVAQRRECAIDEFGISPEIVDASPVDEPLPDAPPALSTPPRPG